jgi:hypothetical protein
LKNLHRYFKGILVYPKFFLARDSFSHVLFPSCPVFPHNEEGALADSPFHPFAVSPILPSPFLPFPPVEGRKGAYGGVDVHVLRLEDEKCEPKIGEAEEYDHQHALVSSLRHMHFFA